jgi:nicotinamide mononucleotide transporter
MSWLEFVAVALSLLAVWWTTRRNAWCWPTGLASVLLYAWIFFTSRLYSDALLQLAFAALLIYGWWCWRRAPRANDLPLVRRPAWRDIFVPLGTGTLGALALGALMANYTDASIPWLDATLTALSLVAQYWMARLYRINWPLWIALDVVYVGVYITKDLPLTAGLYAVFIALAVFGWRQWGRAQPSA